MVKLLRLVKTGFDTMENHNPLFKEEIGVFVDDGDMMAHGKIGDWLKDNGPFEFYLGYDGNVYPRFDVEVVVPK